MNDKRKKFDEPIEVRPLEHNQQTHELPFYVVDKYHGGISLHLMKATNSNSLAMKSPHGFPNFIANIAPPGSVGSNSQLLLNFRLHFNQSMCPLKWATVRKKRADMNKTTEATDPDTCVTESDPNVAMKYSSTYECHLYSVKKPGVDVVEELNNQLNLNCNILAE